MSTAVPLCTEAPVDLFTGVQWHQRWEVFPGVFTPGRNPVARLCAAAHLPANLAGKRVLDVGAWNGCFSFECERRGAAEVVACSLEHPDESGFNRLKRALSSKVRYVQESVYNLSPDQLGQFDLVLFFGVLYHLRHPLLAIDRLRSVCRGEVLGETHVVTDRHLLRGRRAARARLRPTSRPSRARHLRKSRPEECRACAPVCNSGNAFPDRVARRDASRPTLWLAPARARGLRRKQPGARRGSGR